MYIWFSVKISLRPVRREDWEFILKVRNQEEVRFACHDTSIIDFETHKQYMDRLEKDPSVYQWIITCDNHDVGHTKIIGQEFGYMIKDGFRGRGIGSRFHELVFEEARRLGIHKLKDTIRIENKASLKLALKTGFIQTGLIYADNKPYAYTLEKTIG
jgi:RimJ/RimL family protein N-acetyltransferase